MLDFTQLTTEDYDTTDFENIKELFIQYFPNIEEIEGEFDEFSGDFTITTTEQDFIEVSFSFDIETDKQYIYIAINADSSNDLYDMQEYPDGVIEICVGKYKDYIESL